LTGTCKKNRLTKSSSMVCCKCRQHRGYLPLGWPRTVGNVLPYMQSQNWRPSVFVPPKASPSTPNYYPAARMERGPNVCSREQFTATSGSPRHVQVPFGTCSFVVMTPGNSSGHSDVVLPDVSGRPFVRIQVSNEAPTYIIHIFSGISGSELARIPHAQSALAPSTFEYYGQGDWQCVGGDCFQGTSANLSLKPNRKL
jgi:hypothetical protein